MDGKKSFIAYCDWIETFEALSDATAGKLIKHLLQYVNDQDPKSKDAMVNLAFIPLRQSLKRDLKKYESYLEKQRANGAKGGRPPKPKETQETQGLKNEPKKADSVNDSDTVNVTVNDTKPNIPTLTQFLDHGRILCDRAGLVYKNMVFALEQKYQAWVEAGWKDGHGKAIKIWKTKLGNTLPHLKAINSNNHGQTTEDKYRQVDEVLRVSTLSSSDDQ